MSKIKEVFERIVAQKKEYKQKKAVLTDALKSSPSYCEASEKFERIKQHREGIKIDVLSDYKEAQAELEILASSIRSDQMILNDVALTMIMSGKNIDLETDKAKYSPTIKITYKQQSLF